MSVETERMLLNTFLGNNALLDDDGLDVDLFTDHNHRAVFEVMRSLRYSGAPVTLLTLADFDGLSEKVGGAAFLATLGSIPEASANVEYYLGNLREGCTRRKLASLAKEITNNLSTRVDTQDILLSIESSALAMRKVKAKGITVDNMAVLHAATERMEATMTGQRKGLRTGYATLDRVVGDLEAGQVLLIGARTSRGKTALALSIAHRFFSRGIRVAFVSLEMKAEQIFDRLCAIQSGVPIARVKGYGTTSEDLAEVMRARGALSTVPFALADSGRMTLGGIRAWLIGQATEGAQVAFIDYSGLIEIGDERQPRWEKMASVSAGLKALARECNIPVFVLCQLNRLAAGEEEPRLDHLRDSGSFEQDSDVVVLLSMPEAANDQDTVSATLHVAKNRTGATGYVKLLFRRSLTKFVEATL